MARTFDVCELIQAALSKKQKSIHIYKQLSEMTPDSVDKTVFMGLSKKTARNLKTFRLLLDRIENTTIPEHYSDTFVDYLELMTAEANQENTVGNADEHLSADQLLHAAISSEREKLLLLIDIAGIIESEYQDTIVQIIEVVRNHLVIISKFHRIFHENAPGAISVA